MNKRPEKAACKVTAGRIPEVFPDGRYLYSMKELQWMTSSYRRSEFMPENLRYETKGGLRVRSKSERSIADTLTERGIPFRYEAEFMAGGKTYYPDFTILRKDGGLVIWEHLGMTDNRDYLVKTWMKLEAYRKAGYRTHTDLICTYEEDMVSEAALENIIDRYISEGEAKERP